MADATSSVPQRRAKRSKQKQMKQMQGILSVERVGAKSIQKTSAPHSQKLRQMQVLLLPEQLEMRLFALDDNACEQLVDRINLRHARLEQLQRGFLVHEESDQIFHLQDDEKQVQDAWFLAIYQAIAHTKRLAIAFTAASSLQITPVSSFRDETTGSFEFELLCELQSVGFPRQQWKIWKLYTQVRAFDEQLRSVLEPSNALNSIVFPRERKRDFLLGGLRKKFLQEVKQQQIGLYFEKVLSLKGLFARPIVRELLKEFISFEVFFEEVVGSSTSPPLPETQDHQEQQDTVAEPNGREEGEQERDSRQQEPVSSDEDNAPGTVRWHNEVDNQHVPDLEHQQEVDMRGALTEPLSQDFQQKLTLNHRSTSNFSRSLSHSDVPLEQSQSSNDEWSSEEEPGLVTDPKAAKRLHKRILKEVSECVFHDEERVQAFQDQTRDFGRDRMSATEYVAFLHGAVGMENCCRLLLQMVRLLPDEDKREQLLEARAVLAQRYQKRRNKKRSKQFSEGTALNSTAISTFDTPTKQPSTKSRSKSESLASWSVPTHQLASAADDYNFGRNSLSGHPLSNGVLATTTEATVEEEESAAAAWNRPLTHRLSIFGEDIGTTEDIAEETPEETAAEAEEDVHQTLAIGGTTDHPALYSPSQWPQGQQPQSESQHQQGESSPPEEEPRVHHSRKNISVFMQKQQESGEEVNPILQRLRKQGAVNFMMR